MRTPGRYLFLLMLFGSVFASASSEDPLSKDLDSDSFSAQEPTFAGSNWSSSIGGGVSIPQNVEVTYPSFFDSFISGQSLLFIINQPIKKPLEYSYIVEANVTRRVTDWMSLGGQLGYSIGHGIDVGQSDYGGDTGLGPNGAWGIFYPIAGPIPSSIFTIDYSMNILSFMPVVKMGPQLMTNETGWRPYGLFGVGGDYVTQTAHLNWDGHTYHYYSREDVYVSATAGGGIGWKNDHFSISGEVRYETVFKPSDPLRFLIPTAIITYAF